MKSVIVYVLTNFSRYLLQCYCIILFKIFLLLYQIIRLSEHEDRLCSNTSR